MNLALWIIAGLLAVAVLASGAMKLARPKEKLAAFGRDGSKTSVSAPSRPSAPWRSWLRWA